ncbi:sulfotransferase family protein [Verrucomicrobiales bacterium]|jgi:hypothetical protein|nr:sulfotransferase family protein [Verrucomicrobiales bacterium]
MKRLLSKAKNRAKRLLTDLNGPIDMVNDAVNFDLECIFIAVPKTGTTSVRTQIRKQGNALIPNPHLNIVQVRDLLYPFILRSSLGNNRTYPSEGVPSDKDIRNQAEKTFNEFFKFSAVRNPWARAASLYFRREGVQANEEMTFERFCEQHLYASDTCFHPTLHKNQLDWLCDENDRMIMDFVYKLEDFEDAIEQIANRTNGRVKLIKRKANKNPNSRSSDYKDIYTDRARKLISKAFEKDIDFFQYTF